MKLLIADDEMQIRTGLAQGIEWAALGIREVFTAENGIEALELSRKEKPEIVLTDIQMPGLSGLDLGRQIRKSYQPVAIIILSGYSEFVYAREAIEIGAFDYLLKPINIQHLLERVQRAMDTVEKEKMLSCHSRIARQAQRMQTIEGLIRLPAKLKGQDYEKMKSCVKLDFQKEMLAVLCAADTADPERGEQAGELLLQLLQKEMSSLRGSVLFQRQGTLYFMAEVFTEAEYRRKLDGMVRMFEEINQILRQQLAVTATCAVSRSAFGEELPLLFEECRQLIRHRMYLGGGRVILSDPGLLGERLMVSPVDPGLIRNHIAKFDYGFMGQYLEGIFAELRQMKATSTDFIKGICLELKNMLLNVVSERGMDVYSILKQNEMLLNDIPDYCFLEEYHAWIDNLYYLILNGMAQVTGAQHSRAVIQSIDYISHHYAGDVKLEDMAEYVHKSKNYFSYLFKKETGMSFVEYLNHVRIEQAKILLDSTDKMTYEICEQVGYKDYKYFSSVFKKAAGLSPSQYRKRGES